MTFSSDFVGVDGAAFGDGQADTQAMDAALQTRLFFNMYWLVRYPGTVCLSPVISSADDLTTTAGIRPYMSAGGAITVMSSWVQLYRSQTRADFTLLYQNLVPNNAGTAAGDVDVKIWVEGYGESDWTELAQTYSGGVVTGHQTVSVTLDEKVIADQTAKVLIWMRSANDETRVTTTAGTKNNLNFSVLGNGGPLVTETTTSGAFFHPNSSGTHPEKDALECNYLLPSNSSGDVAPAAQNKPIDLIITEEKSANLTSAAVVQSYNADASTAARYAGQCLMVRAILYRPYIVAGAWAAMDIGRLRPNIEFGGSEAIIMANNARQLYFRPRVLAYGPRGKKLDRGSGSSSITIMDGYDKYNYAAHWPFVMGDWDDGAGGDPGEHTRLVNDLVMLTTENPTIKVRCLWLSVQHGTDSNSDPASDKNNPDIAGKTTTVKGQTTKTEGFDVGAPTGRATWTISAALEQFTDNVTGTADLDTDVTLYGGVSEVREIPVHPSSFLSDQTPVLRGADSDAQTGKSATYPSFWFKEGSFYPRDLSEVNLVETEHIFNVSGMDSASIKRVPMRLRLNADLNNFDDPLDADNTAAAQSGDLKLMLVGYIATEYPEDPNG